MSKAAYQATVSVEITVLATGDESAFEALTRDTLEEAIEEYVRGRLPVRLREETGKISTHMLLSRYWHPEELQRGEGEIGVMMMGKPHGIKVPVSRLVGGEA